ncbi:hypothetical protein COY23_02780 [bacterium (Candidatus Torokbacteria) CG_4_10_14_0_2_um_filter_35_8]|nr:MAG: hypothetical protein COY23_02780 [bacterium (Candidatus Torokbacteria) CG_4_10_14_0_2_um_filter_35_8]
MKKDKDYSNTKDLKKVLIFGAISLSLVLGIYFIDSKYNTLTKFSKNVFERLKESDIYSGLK